jgi:hypothetical protein
VVPAADATQAVVVSTDWAVQRDVTPVSLFLWIEAMNSRTSETSICVVEPKARCGVMLVSATTSVMFALRDGVPPGVKTLRKLIWFKSAGLVPMMYPSVEAGS